MGYIEKQLTRKIRSEIKKNKGTSLPNNIEVVDMWDDTIEVNEEEVWVMPELVGKVIITVVNIFTLQDDCVGLMNSARSLLYEFRKPP
jgi:hypothetical protein